MSRYVVKTYSGVVIAELASFRQALTTIRLQEEQELLVINTWLSTIAYYTSSEDSLPERYRLLLEG